MSQTKAQLIDAAATFTISSDASFNSVTVGKGQTLFQGTLLLEKCFRCFCQEC